MNFGQFNMVINGCRVTCYIELVSDYDYSNPSNDPVFLVRTTFLHTGIPRHRGWNTISKYPKYWNTISKYYVNLATKSVSPSVCSSWRLNAYERKRMVYRCKKIIRSCKTSLGTFRYV